MKLGLKDVDLMIKAAIRVSAELPSANLVKSNFTEVYQKDGET